MAFSNDKCKSFYRLDDETPVRSFKDHIENRVWKMRVEKVSWKEYNEQLKIYNDRETKLDAKLKNGEAISW